MYLGHMRSYALFFKQSPAELTEQHIREYLHHLIKEKDASQSMVSQPYSALKFFYTVTLQRV